MELLEGRRLLSANAAQASGVQAVVGPVANWSGPEAADQAILAVTESPPLLNVTSTPLGYFAPGPAAVVDPNVTITNPAQIDEITGATVSISSGFVAGEDQLAADVTGLSITASYSPATGMLSLNGNNTPSAYQTALQSITYQDAAADPTLSSRIITFTVRDLAGSNSASRMVTVSANQPAAVKTTSQTLDYVPDSGLQAVDAGVTVMDSTQPNLAAATVSISSGYVKGEQTLVFSAANGIVGFFDPSMGVLTLSGSASVVNYQTALASVEFNDNNHAPETTDLTVAFAVTDGFLTSNTATRTILLNPLPWQNPVLAVDVNADQAVTPEDALIVINQLNSVGPGPLAAPASEPPPFFYDVSGDNELSPIDALIVINYLNAHVTQTGNALLSSAPALLAGGNISAAALGLADASSISPAIAVPKVFC